MWTGRQDWTFRTHVDYDPNLIGAITQARVSAALVEAGKIVLNPYVHTPRYDLVIDDLGRFFRVQCKTGHLLRGAVYFSTQSLRAAKRGTEWRRIAFDYQGQIEYFGVYCPDNGSVYLVPIEDTATKRMCALRITPAKNNQQKRIRWAKDYEVRPVGVAPQT
jgi:PD-(D/E)XK endonuclease